MTIDLILVITKGFPKKRNKLLGKSFLSRDIFLLATIFYLFRRTTFRYITNFNDITNKSGSSNLVFNNSTIFKVFPGNSKGTMKYYPTERYYELCI